MSFSEKLKKSVNYYKKNCNIQELNYVLEEIKQNPKIIVNDIKENLTVLMSIVCHKYSPSDYNDIIPLKISIFDILISLIEFSDISWYLVEHVGIISILFDEFYCETEIGVKIKILKCIEIYLLFEQFESKLYGQCNSFCCDLGGKRVIGEVKIFEICQSIIQSLIGLDDDSSCQSSSSSSNIIESHLIALSFIFRRFSINLSPELCGDIDTFKLFNKFLLSVCESDRYSSISAISALSCFYHTSDRFSSNKCFTVTNVEFTVNILYNSLTKSELNSQMPTSLYAVLLLNDVLHNQTIANYIKQQWTLVHYKSVCKLLIYEFPSAHYEKVLELFCTIKSIIPEWNGVIEKYLMSNSKFLKFLNDLTCKPLNNSAIMAWQLLQSYFQPTEIPSEFLPEFCSLILNSVKTNLESSFYCQQQQQQVNDESSSSCSSNSSLTNRSYMRAIMRASSALDMMLLMASHDDIAACLANISAKIHLIPFIESLIKDLLDESHNALLSIKSSDHDILCESNNWFTAATRLCVSLVFFGVNMSTRYPNLICRKNLNAFLVQPIFLRVLVVCLTRSTSSFLIGRSIALIVVSSQFADCDMSKLSEMICDSTMQFNVNCQSHLKIKQSSSSSSSATFSFDDVSLKYKSSIRKLVDSWINDQKSLSESDLTTIFVEEIKNLREHQDSLEDFIKKKDDYIRHCQNLTNEYRTKMLNNDNRFHKLMTKHVEMQKSSDNQSVVIVNLTDQLTKQEKIYEKKETEIITLKSELEKFRLSYSELESKYKKEVKKNTDAEVLVDDLHKRLANYQEELEKTKKELQQKQKINKIINDLIGNKISPESFSSTEEGC